jgi:hypothetical protein
VPEGKVTAVLGPSGSGKSTALKVVGGLVPATDGRVLVGGEDITALPSERRNVGIVFQSYALFPNMTVEDNIGFGLKVRGVPPAPRRERVGAMLRAMKIEHLRDKRTRQISGGEAQRVARPRHGVQATHPAHGRALSALDADPRRPARRAAALPGLRRRPRPEASPWGPGGDARRVVQWGRPPRFTAGPRRFVPAAFNGANLVPCTAGISAGSRAVGAVEAGRHRPGESTWSCSLRREHRQGNRAFTVKVEEVVYLKPRAVTNTGGTPAAGRRSKTRWKSRSLPITLDMEPPRSREEDVCKNCTGGRSRR